MFPPMSKTSSLLAPIGQRASLSQNVGILEFPKDAQRLRQMIGKRNFSASTKNGKQKLVILGSGWGGYDVLRRVDKKKWDVSVISPTSYFAFTPLLASTAVGTLEFRCAGEPVRRYNQAQSYLAWADRIDFTQKTIECMPATEASPLSITLPPTSSTPSSSRPPPPTFSSSTSSSPAGTSIPVASAPDSTESLEKGEASMIENIGIGDQKVETERGIKKPVVVEVEKGKERKRFYVHYDKLVIGVGAYAATFGIPGVKEHSHFLKNLTDARAIRGRVFQCFEEASLPTKTDEERKALLHFVIVGGGPTGVEFAAELHDLLKSDIARAYPNVEKFSRITVYDVAEKILSGFDDDLREYATRRFGREGITIKGNRKVSEVKKGALVTEQDGEIPAGLILWSTGNSSNPLVKSITQIEKNKRGQLLVNPKLQAISSGISSGTTNRILEKGNVMEDVWILGDASSIEGGSLPATAQVASQQAKYLANTLNAIVRDRPEPGPFNWINRGMLAYVGDWRAIFDRTHATGEGPKTTGAGLGAWLIWRSSYFVNTLSLRNKVLVPWFWFCNWIFGRDVTQF